MLEHQRSTAVPSTSLTFVPLVEQKHRLHLHQQELVGNTAREQQQPPLLSTDGKKKHQGSVRHQHTQQPLLPSKGFTAKCSPPTRMGGEGWGRVGVEDKVSHLFSPADGAVKMQIRFKVMFAKTPTTDLHPFTRKKPRIHRIDSQRGRRCTRPHAVTESDLRLSTEQSAASSATKRERNEKKSELKAEHQWEAEGAQRKRKSTSHGWGQKRENGRFDTGLFSGI